MFTRPKTRLGKAVLFTFPAICVAIATSAFAVPASADELPVEETITTPMYVGGYNEEVAEANGFEIVIGEDGQPYSVAVTPEAQELEASFEAPAGPGGISAFNIVYGWCGSSSLNISRTFNGINVATSYSVIAPTYWHNWNVTGASNRGGWSAGFSGANANSYWSATRFVNLGSYSSGFGQVSTGSYALLVNGLICYSGGPSASF